MFLALKKIPSREFIALVPKNIDEKYRQSVCSAGCYFAVNIPLLFNNCIPFRSRSRPVFCGSGSDSEQTVSAAPAPAPTKMCRLRRLRLRLRLRIPGPIPSRVCNARPFAHPTVPNLEQTQKSIHLTQSSLYKNNWDQSPSSVYYIIG